MSWKLLIFYYADAAIVTNLERPDMWEILRNISQYVMMDVLLIMENPMEKALRETSIGTVPNFWENPSIRHYAASSPRSACSPRKHQDVKKHGKKRLFWTHPVFINQIWSKFNKKRRLFHTISGVKKPFNSSKKRNVRAFKKRARFYENIAILPQNPIKNVQREIL